MHMEAITFILKTLINNPKNQSKPPLSVLCTARVILFPDFKIQLLVIIVFSVIAACYLSALSVASYYRKSWFNIPAIVGILFLAFLQVYIDTCFMIFKFCKL